jgi:hypothetical protein
MTPHSIQLLLHAVPVTILNLAKELFFVSAGFQVKHMSGLVCYIGKHETPYTGSIAKPVVQSHESLAIADPEANDLVRIGCVLYTFRDWQFVQGPHRYITAFAAAMTSPTFGNASFSRFAA